MEKKRMDRENNFYLLLCDYYFKEFGHIDGGSIEEPTLPVSNFIVKLQ